MRSGLNELVPADDLHWNDDDKCFGILSKKETDDLILACMKAGLDDPRDILKVVKEYEFVRAGNLLFGRFMNGSIGISGFDESGSPIFASERNSNF